MVDEATHVALLRVPLERVATMRSLKDVDQDGGYYKVPERLSQQFREMLAAP